MSEEDKARYIRAMHAMQTGIAYLLEKDPTPSHPKHVRLGINSAMVQNAALATILMDKGIMTRDEYDKVMADMSEAEVALYEAELAEKYRTVVKLH